MTDFLDYLEIKKRLADKSQENYARFLTKFFNWLHDNNLSKLKPGQLTKDHIWKYQVFLSRHVNARTKKSLKKSTQNYYLIALRCLLEYFADQDLTSLSPTKVTLAKDKSVKQIKFLKLEEVERLLLAPDLKSKQGLRDRAILETLFSTGLRVAELVGLQRDQINTKLSTDGIEISVVGKGDRVRTIYFSQRAIDWLKLYLDKRQDLDPALFINYKPGIEKTNKSRQLTTKSIEEIVKKYIVIAGLPVMSTPHTLRHSYATDLLSQGVDIRLVQEFLGHSNIATTQIYTHVTNKQLRDVHRKFHGGNKLKK